MLARKTVGWHSFQDNAIYLKVYRCMCKAISVLETVDEQYRKKSMANVNTFGHADV